MAFNKISSYLTYIESTSLPIKIAVALLCGTVSAYAHAPNFLTVNFFIGLSCLYILLSTSTPKHSFFLGWSFAFCYFAFSLSWIGNALLVEGNDYAWAWPLAVSGLPALLAFFPAIACYVARRLTDLKTITGFFVFTGVIALSEYVRGHLFTGFPWNLYGYVWGHNLSIAQISSFGGIYFLTLLSVFWACFLGFVFVTSKKNHAMIILFLAVFTFAFAYLIGQSRLVVNKTEYHDHVVLRLVQPNIKQEDKWTPNKAWENLNTLLALSLGQEDNTGKANENLVIIWPETAISYKHLSTPSVTSAIKQTLSGIKNNNISLLSGYLNKINKDNSVIYHNSLNVFNENFEPINRYNKSHLVPFGEYIPFQDWIPLEPVTKFTGFNPGKGPQTVTLNDLPNLSPLICYEIIFPGNVTGKNGQAEWIVNVTNDAWYGDSAGPYQHFLKSRFRAIEEGIPVVRVANTGISGIIDPSGRALLQTEIFTAVSNDHKLPKKLTRPTWYASYGDILFFLSIFSLFAPFLYQKLRR